MTKANAIILLKHFKDKGMTKQVEEILRKYPDLDDTKKEEDNDAKKPKRK